MTWCVAWLLALGFLLLCFVAIFSSIASIPGNPPTASFGLKLVHIGSISAALLFGLGVPVFFGWGIGLVIGVF